MADIGVPDYVFLLGIGLIVLILCVVAWLFIMLTLRQIPEETGYKKTMERWSHALGLYVVFMWPAAIIGLLAFFICVVIFGIEGFKSLSGS